MRPKNYKDITDYEGMDICGLRGLFTNYRINRDLLPYNLKALSIREGENDFLGTLEEKVWANHMGDFLVNRADCPENIDWNIENQYTYLNEKDTSALKCTLLR